MVTKTSRRLLALTTSFVLLYLLFPHLYYYGDYIRQTNPFSGQRSIEQAFTPTDSELACLRGGHGHGHHVLPNTSDLKDDNAHPAHHSPTSISSSSSSSFISSSSSSSYNLRTNPKHCSPLHLRPLQPSLGPSAGHFDFLSYLAVRAALVSLQPTELKLHYTYLSSPPSPDPNAQDPLSNPWIRRLTQRWPGKFKLVHHPPPPETESKAQYAHKSDTLRLQILLEEGGIYLDIDVFAFRSFAPLLSRGPTQGRDTILGYEGGNRWGLCNAVIVARRPNATFIRRWLDTYLDENVDLEKEAWNYRSVLLPKELMAVEQHHFHLDEKGDDGAGVGKEEGKEGKGKDQKGDDVCALPPTPSFGPHGLGDTSSGCIPP
ncbi:unnamed protein product [Sordaria macrospora k-hell]|uniref:WGS project CABT00000000 data, contig 2.39 n=1 Tax=Sordaria macrospora (strain ATCC MYA-333 / DSM 997 / K(L3346) / K-hell) TaxID=771870 RepID=F7W7L6_SORMK|nr:uncharacterized protein SMAC_07124 [Sordaria macrospora k-hell]CCC13500.1 unnamed protein product [Sordaria macrospora k-hell]